MLNLKSNRTPWSNFLESHPSPHYSSPSTLNYAVLSNPSNSSLHQHLLIYLAYQSYYTLLMSRTLFMFMTMMKFWKIFQTSLSYYESFFEKKNPKKFENQYFFSVWFLRILKMFNEVPPVKFRCNFSNRWFFI